MINFSLESFCFIVLHMNPSKTKFLMIGLAVVGLGTVLGTALWLRLGPHAQFGRGAGDSADGLNQYGSVPDFSLTERNGGAVGLAQLRGKIWVADFIYTTCTDTCPLQTAMMAKVQREYLGKADLQFVSITVDPERDTPQVLAQYADKHRADAARWYFLTGQRDRIMRLIQQGFHLAVMSAPVDGGASGAIPHSPRFVLVDKEGRIRGYYDSRELDGLIRLKNDIDALLKG
jgi:protein SCO1/2